MPTGRLTFRVTAPPPFRASTSTARRAARALDSTERTRPVPSQCSQT